MRISDWSSDVCSSDLAGRPGGIAEEEDGREQAAADRGDRRAGDAERRRAEMPEDQRVVEDGVQDRPEDHRPEGDVSPPDDAEKIGRASGRERVCQYV